MAGDARTTAASIDAAAAAISSAHLRYPLPEQSRWKGYWARYWCFGSQKRDKRIVPASRGDGSNGSAQEWTTDAHPQAGLALAPPSSPASFVNSSVQSPASFTLALSAASVSMYSPGPSNTMFTIGPYAHETQLVSPPVFSTFTTEPSTAPFTPPPELSHLTTPSSPDVPFAQWIASSLEAKATMRDSISPFSTSTLASPCDTPGSYLPSSFHLYLGSPVGHLISPNSGFMDAETTSNVQEVVFPAQLSASSGQTISYFPTFEPFTSETFDGAPCMVLTCLSSESNQAVTCPEDFEVCLRSQVELDLCCSSDIQGRAAENTDIHHLSVHQNGSNSAALHLKEKPNSFRAERLGEYGPAKNSMQISHTDNEDRCCNACSKDGCYINITNGASKGEDAGTADVRLSHTVAME